MVQQNTKHFRKVNYLKRPTDGVERDSQIKKALEEHTVYLAFYKQGARFHLGAY